MPDTNIASNARGRSNRAWLPCCPGTYCLRQDFPQGLCRYIYKAKADSICISRNRRWPVAVEIFLISFPYSLSVQPLNSPAHKRISAAEKIDSGVNNGTNNVFHRVVHQVHIRHRLVGYINILNLLE